MHRSTSYYFY